MISRSNPFATKFIRAGALPFCFSEGQSIESFYRRLIMHQWRGQIVGPHGSGKTTLLRKLDSCWSGWARECVLLTAQNGQRSIPLNDSKRWNERTQVVVDGYEQLGIWCRLRLHSLSRWRKSGLLVTTHTQVGWLPVVYETRMSLALAKRLASVLINDVDLSAELESELALGLHNHDGNLRETFFHLYDVYQRKTQAGESCHQAS